MLFLGICWNFAKWADNDYLVVRISQIESRIMAIQGVIDISGTKINGNAANLTLTPFEIPVFGVLVHDP